MVDGTDHATGDPAKADPERHGRPSWTRWAGLLGDVGVLALAGSASGPVEPLGVAGSAASQLGALGAASEADVGLGSAAGAAHDVAPWRCRASRERRRARRAAEVEP